ncbi:MAG: hypothetical protein ACLRIL_08615 [Fusicatenibacter saccharivorans]
MKELLAEDREIPSGRNAAEDVEGISLDFSVRQKVLESHAFYTVLGIFGTGVSLASSVISKDLVDIITGHQTGKLMQNLCIDDRIFLWKYPDFPGDQLCLDDGSSESRPGNPE